MSAKSDLWSRRLNRRALLGLGGLGTVALALGPLAGRAEAAGFGPMVPDPGGVIDLPSGFRYRVLSQQGSTLSNGAPVPGDPDGMAAFQGPGDTTILVRNHELAPAEGPPVVGTNPYRATQRGGTTGIVVGPDRTVIEDYVASSGTQKNCAGGRTPWGTWLTCEETRSTHHGYVFEVMPGDPENALSKTPIRGMGFFSHEAAGVDPATGIVYLTEDDYRGTLPSNPNAETAGSRVSFLYRYVPSDPSPAPGALQKGGTLQVMTLEQGNFNADLANPGQSFGVVWRNVNPTEPHADAQAKGATRFNRLEGAYFSGGAFWFDDTSGGEKRLGQIFRYRPATGTLELFYEATDAKKMESPDNIVVTTWGDLWFAENGYGRDRIMGITPGGQVYAFASNRSSNFEFSGPCFAPDGRTFFVNVQQSGLTLAVWGPFPQPSTARQRRMSHAAPPQTMAPKVSGELAEAAEEHGMTALEAAAYHSLGVPVA